MKKLFTLLLLAAVCFSASAQYRDISSNNISAFELVQIDEYDGITAFFFTINAEEDVNLTINDNTCIYVEGGAKRCRMTKAANIPYSSDNTYLQLKAGDKANIVLEFESVPLDKTFSMFEDRSKNGFYMFNIEDIKVNKESTSPTMDLLDFINYYDSKYTGVYAKEGKNWRFYDYNGLSVGTSMILENLDLVRIGQINITIDNASGHDVKFSPRNIKVEARKRSNQKYDVLSVFTKTEYDTYVSRDINTQTGVYASNVNPVANTVGHMRRYDVKKDDVGTQIGLGVLEAILRSNDGKKIADFQDGLEENRARLWDNYMEDATVPDNGSYGGFVAFRQKGYKQLRITISMGGFDYVFLVEKK